MVLPHHGLLSSPALCTCWHLCPASELPPGRYRASGRPCYSRNPYLPFSYPSHPSKWRWLPVLHLIARDHHVHKFQDLLVELHLLIEGWPSTGGLVFPQRAGSRWLDGLFSMFPTNLRFPMWRHLTQNQVHLRGGNACWVGVQWLFFYAFSPLPSWETEQTICARPVGQPSLNPWSIRANHEPWSRAKVIILVQAVGSLEELHPAVPKG